MTEPQKPIDLDWTYKVTSAAIAPASAVALTSGARRRQSIGTIATSIRAELIQSGPSYDICSPPSPQGAQTSSWEMTTKTSVIAPSRTRGSGLGGDQAPSRSRMRRP